MPTSYYEEISLDSEYIFIPDATERSLLAKYKQKFWTSDDMLSIYIGIFCFLCTLSLTLMGLHTPNLQSWYDFDDILISLDLISFPFLIIGTLIISVLRQLNYNRKKMVLYYVFIIVLVIAANLVGRYDPIESKGFGPPFWSVVFGLCFRILFQLTKRCHHITVSSFQKTIIHHDSTIKIAIIIFGVDFVSVSNDLTYGLIIAWVKTTLIFIIIMFAGYKLINIKIGLLLSSGISICGQLAVGIVGEIIDMDKFVLAKILSIMSLSIIPSIISIPSMAIYLNLTDELRGIWIGGSVDSLGAVITSSSLNNMNVVKNAIIIKSFQILLIIPLAFICRYFLDKIIPKRTVLNLSFPKFIIGYLITSIITTFYPQKEFLINNTYLLSQWFANIAFILMGFDINLKILKYIKEDWRIFLIYLGGFLLDTGITLFLGYVIFEL